MQFGTSLSESSRNVVHPFFSSGQCCAFIADMVHPTRGLHGVNHIDSSLHGTPIQVLLYVGFPKRVIGFHQNVNSDVGWHDDQATRHSRTISSARNSDNNTRLSGGMRKGYLDHLQSEGWNGKMPCDGVNSCRHKGLKNRSTVVLSHPS